MKQNKLIPFIFLLIIIPTVACLQTRSDMKDGESQVFQNQVKNLQQNQSEMSSEMQEIKAELQRMNGRVEVVESKVTAVNRDMHGKSQLGEDQLANLSKRLKTVEDATLSISQRMDAIVDELRDLRLKQKKTAQIRTERKRGPFTQADLDYSKKRWGEAAINYMKYRDLNPKGRRYAEATFKIGYCFQRLGKAAQALAFYNEVQNRYPKSAYSKKALVQLRKIKKPN